MVIQIEGQAWGRTDGDSGDVRIKAIKGGVMTRRWRWRRRKMRRRRRGGEKKRKLKKEKAKEKEEVGEVKEVLGGRAVEGHALRYEDAKAHKRYGDVNVISVVVARVGVGGGGVSGYVCVGGLRIAHEEF